MKIFNGPRLSGKSLALIFKALQLQQPILAPVMQMKKRLLSLAKKNGVEVTVYTVAEYEALPVKPKHIIIDEFQHVLKLLLGTSVSYAAGTNQIEHIGPKEITAIPNNSGKENNEQ